MKTTNESCSSKAENRSNENLVTDTQRILRNNAETDERSETPAGEAFNEGNNGSPVKSQKTRGAETANDLERSGKPEKIGLAQSEKNLLVKYDKVCREFFPAMLSGNRDALKSARSTMLARFHYEENKLKEAGALESAAVLRETFLYFAAFGTFPTLENVRFVRGKIQAKRKEERTRSEAAAKAAKIQEAAELYGIPLKAALAMFNAGVLKL